MKQDFVLDMQRIRKDAQKQMANGPVTEDYLADPAVIIKMLDQVVATEIVCWLRYQRHAISATGLGSREVTDEFREHAAEEMNHALLAAERISQLGGDPDFSPKGLHERAQTEYTTFEDGDLAGMLRENLVAERIVIQIYSEMIRWIGDADPTTRRMLEGILAEEEEHADDLADLLEKS